MTVLSTIVSALTNVGYDVATSPQEAMRPKTIVVTLESFDIEVETANSYFTRPKLSMNFINNDLSKILTTIPSIMNTVEKAIVSTVRDFHFDEVEVNMTDGNEYLIAIKLTYTEVLTIG